MIDRPHHEVLGGVRATMEVEARQRGLLSRRHPMYWSVHICRKRQQMPPLELHAGKKMLAPEASNEIAEHATDDGLTAAEILVLRLIAEGNANKQIADQLSITEDTVKSRVKLHPFQVGRERQNPRRQ